MPIAEKHAGLSSQLPNAAPDDLYQRLADARRKSDSLFSLVHRDSLYDRPIPERHRIIFYVGHLEAFDWNLLSEPVLAMKAVHPEFDRLFAFGIDPVGGGLPSDLPSDWPSLEAVGDYVDEIRYALDKKLEKAITQSPASNTGIPLSTLLNVAIEHRLMHIETLSYMLHQLAVDKLDTKMRPPDFPHVLAEPVSYSAIPIPAGVATLGLSRDAQRFGWDNEFESHTVHVPAFEIDRYKVTNQQYLEFVAAGGYEQRDLWSNRRDNDNDDWDWKTSHGISHPLFWRENKGQWLWRRMFGEVPLPLDWPVYVSHAEASAYARWAGKALPTESEWQHAAYGAPEGSSNSDASAYPWGSEAPNSRLGNFDFSHSDPAPVNAFPAGRSSFGVEDLHGNGWEWTSTPFAPFPGFKAFPFYRGYSADFFDGKHFVMKGGSARTAACMLRPTFRNWFQAHYQYVYAGFRCVSH